MKRFLLAVLAAAGLMAAPALADGPETGIIRGSVKDAQGNPLPGVVVTLSGPRGNQDAVTDNEGVYRFALLVPGDYRVRAEMEGFQPVEAGAAVSAGAQQEVALVLRLGTSEEITVTSEAPMAAPRSTPRSASRPPARPARTTASSTPCPASPTTPRTRTSSRAVRPSTATTGPTSRCSSTASTPASRASAAPACSCRPPRSPR
jgi:hypothetical protein